MLHASVLVFPKYRSNPQGRLRYQPSEFPTTSESPTELPVDPYCPMLSSVLAAANVEAVLPQRSPRSYITVIAFPLILRTRADVHTLPQLVSRKGDVLTSLPTFLLNPQYYTTRSGLVGLDLERTCRSGRVVFGLQRTCRAGSSFWGLHQLELSSSIMHLAALIKLNLGFSAQPIDRCARSWLPVIQRSLQGDAGLLHASGRRRAGREPGKEARWL